MPDVENMKKEIVKLVDARGNVLLAEFADKILHSTEKLSDEPDTSCVLSGIFIKALSTLIQNRAIQVNHSEKLSYVYGTIPIIPATKEHENKGMGIGWFPVTFSKDINFQEKLASYGEQA